MQLVNDAKNNTASKSPEAVYVNTILVPAGTTLDLNNLHLYARTLKIAGKVVNGTVQQVPPGPPVTTTFYSTTCVGEARGFPTR